MGIDYIINDNTECFHSMQFPASILCIFNSQPISFFPYTAFPLAVTYSSLAAISIFPLEHLPCLRCIGALNFLLIMLQDSADTLGASDTNIVSAFCSGSRPPPSPSSFPSLAQAGSWLNKLQLFASQLCTHAHSLAQFSFVSLDFVIAFGFAHCIWQKEEKVEKQPNWDPDKKVSLA